MNNLKLMLKLKNELLKEANKTVLTNEEMDNIIIVHRTVTRIKLLTSWMD